MGTEPKLPWPDFRQPFGLVAPADPAPSRPTLAIPSTPRLRLRQICPFPAFAPGRASPEASRWAGRRRTPANFQRSREAVGASSYQEGGDFPTGDVRYQKNWWDGSVIGPGLKPTPAARSIVVLCRAGQSIGAISGIVIRMSPTGQPGEKRLGRSTALSLLTAVLTLCVAVIVAPSLRHYVVALLNDPNNLQALDNDGRVRFEKDAKNCALDVATFLPGAIELVEARQGRPFRRDPTIGVYVSFDRYARANGLENSSILATYRSGRVILSPALCGAERENLPGVLTHELSHAHFFGWRSSPFSSRPPSWFTEGLAVMVSNGGAAEGVSDHDAAAAIKSGEEIVVEDEGLWRDLASIPFYGDTKPRSSRDGDSRQRLAYRQAAMFVAWLQSSDPSAFARLLSDLENGDRFGEAFRLTFNESPAMRWKQFVADIRGR